MEGLAEIFASSTTFLNGACMEGEPSAAPHISKSGS